MTPPLTDPLALTEAMVRIDSVLPHEARLATFIAGQLEALGLDVTWQEVAPGRPNVGAMATVGPGSTLVTFSGHLDTVPAAEGWKADPWTPVLRDGRLYGLGAADMKSGLACALLAFARVVRHPERFPGVGRVGFAATVDEEGLGTGARALLRTPFARSDLILLPEPFSGATAADPVPLSMPGKILYRIVVRGRPTHALVSPHRGINAVDDAARIVAALPGLPLGHDPALGQASCVTLKIDGGYREYAVVVPERCEIVATRMLVPGETRDAAVAQLRHLVDGLGLESRVTIDTPPPAYDAYRLDPTSPAVRGFADAYQAVHGRPPILGGLMGIADTNIYVAEGGIPTIAYGPTGGALHEPGEWVAVDSLMPCLETLLGTVAGFVAERAGPSP